MKYSKILLSGFYFAVFFNGNSQDIKVRPKLFTLHNAKFSLGAGLESSFAKSFIINSSKPDNLKTIYQDPRLAKEQRNVPYVSYGLVFDLYSANSVIGLLSGFDFSEFNLGVQRGDSTTDLMAISRFEIPLYLKFRFGKVDGRAHFLFILGGVYSNPISCKREQFDARYGDLTTVNDESKEQLKSNFSMSGGIGYEFFIDGHRHLRVALFSKLTYPNSNYLNPDYSEFKPSGNSVLRNYPGFDVREYRITLGFKIMYQFGEALIKMTEAATQKK